MSDVDRERKAMHASTPLTGVVSDREEQQIGWQSKIFSKVCRILGFSVIFRKHLVHEIL